MATDLVLGRGSKLSRPSRRLSRDLVEAQHPAKIASAKIEGAAFATHVALHHASLLSATEARLIRQAPLGEERYRVIVDTFAGYAASEISALVHKG